MYWIKKLKAKGVRGIVDGPDINFQNGGLLLCGDNGTGKSSYIDAIEKVLTGHCSSLDNSGQSISWNKQGQHIECDNAEIELTISDGITETTIALDTEISSLNGEIKEFLETAKEQSFILRRRTLLDFIDAIPSERYKAIASFIKLDEYNTFENAVKELHKRVKGTQEINNEDINQQKQILRELLNVNRLTEINEDTCTSILNKSLEDAGILKINSPIEITNKISEINNLLEPFSNVLIIQKAGILKNSVHNLADVNSLSELIVSYIDSRKKLLDEERKIKGHFYAQVLEKSIEWIKEDQLDKCPICNCDIDQLAVTEYIESRLKENKHLISLRNNLTNVQNPLVSTLTEYINELSDIKNKWIDIFEDEFPKDFQFIITLCELLKSNIIRSLPLSEIVDLVNKFDNSHLATIKDELQTLVIQKLDEIPDNSRYIELSNIKNKLESISFHLTKIKELIILATNLEISKNQLSILTLLIEKGRKNTVQKLLNSVVETADKYFQMIHPGEQIGKPELLIPERGTGSIELIGKFHNRNGNPRGHYSEGHVDSLGLCLFLAIRRISYNQHPELSILILDDIMHSVDAKHRLNTAHLIFSEFSDHQIIVTTHDPLWFEYLKTISRNSHKQFVQKRISYWSLETGPIMGDHLSNYEWLTSGQRITGKPADKVAKAGLLLEEMLQNICNNLGIAIPYRIRGDYTIDPLWTNFYSSAKKNITFYSKSKDILDRIDELRNLRNWVGAHWNEWAQSLTDTEAQIFVDSILEFRDLIYCEKCNQFISKIGGLDGVWSCKRECLRYNKNIEIPNPSPTTSSSIE